MNLYVNIDKTSASFHKVRRFVVDLEDRELFVEWGDGRITRVNNADFSAIMADWPREDKNETNSK